MSRRVDENHAVTDESDAETAAETEAENARFAQLRAEMVETQIKARGIRAAHVLEVMGCLPRERFVLPAYRDRAYADCALPLGPGQTISQPYIVAYMTAQLGALAGVKVLEVGTGAGYQAAVLALLGAQVHTIERDAGLMALTRLRLERLGLTSVCCHVGDGSVGLVEESPFARIVVTAGCPRVPAALIDQLAVGGRMVVPVGGEEGQTLLRIDKQESGTVEQPLLPCRFVKLVGCEGWLG